MEIQKQQQPLDGPLAEDEVDLYEIACSLLRQWRLILAVTLLGGVVSVVLALSIPKEYKVAAQVSFPNVVDVRLLSDRGYLKHDAQNIFQKYYERLISPIHFEEYLEEGNWLSRFYTDEITVNNSVLLQAALIDSLRVEVLRPVKQRPGQELPPKIVSLTMIGGNEPLITEFLNGYIEFIESELLLSIKRSGQKIADLEVKKAKDEISLLRKSAKKVREARLVRLNDALLLAAKVEIKKPDSVRIYSQTSGQGLAGLTSGSGASLFLMGTEYLEGEIQSLQKRVSDDPYIHEIIPLLKRIDQLSLLDFNFEGVNLYTLDKRAAVDGKAEKPKRTLIVIAGGVVSFLLAIFLALIVGAVKRRQHLA